MPCSPLPEEPLPLNLPLARESQRVEGTFGGTFLLASLQGAVFLPSHDHVCLSRWDWPVGGMYQLCGLGLLHKWDWTVGGLYQLCGLGLHFFVPLCPGL